MASDNDEDCLSVVPTAPPCHLTVPSPDASSSEDEYGNTIVTIEEGIPLSTSVASVPKSLNDTTVELYNAIQNQTVNDGISPEMRAQYEKSASTTDKYQDGKDRDIEEFFHIIATKGGRLGVLASIRQPTDPQEPTDRFLYEVYRGTKTAAKRSILSQCLILWITYKKNIKGDRKGRIPQPSSCETYIKHISADLGKKGILFRWDKDFNGVGEFASVMTLLWQEESAFNPLFGTGAMKATFCIDVDTNLRNAVSVCRNGTPTEGKTVYPYFCAVDRQRVIGHLFGRLFGLRGNKEMRNAGEKDFLFGVYERGVDKGEKYVKYVPPISAGRCGKSNSLSVKNTTIIRRNLEQGVMRNPNDPVCIYDLLKYHFEKLPAECENVFYKGKPQDKITDDGIDVYAKRVMGPGSIGDLNRLLMAQIGYSEEEAKRMTNQGNRALLATIIAGSGLSKKEKTTRMRHHNISTTMGYQDARNHKCESQIQSVIAPVPLSRDMPSNPYATSVPPVNPYATSVPVSFSAGPPVNPYANVSFSKQNLAQVDNNCASSRDVCEKEVCV